MYVEQETTFLIGKYKKVYGKQKQSKKHWKKPENLMIKQKHELV